MKIKPLLIFNLSLFIYTSQIIAQNFYIKGRITDEQDKAIPFANISIKDKSKGTQTSESGYFEIKVNNNDKAKIQISALQYKKAEFEVIPMDSNYTFKLMSDEKQLEEIQVSGFFNNNNPKENSVPILTLNQAEVIKNGSNNIIDAIAKLPGVSQIQTGSQLSKPVIRGLGFNRVITMHDGTRQEDNQWGEEHAIQIDEFSIDRYEIIKGAGSLLYGSDGLGGVVAMFSPKHLSYNGLKFSSTNTFHSNNGMIGSSAFLNGRKNNFIYQFRISAKNASNYENKYDGKVFGSNFREPININGMVGIQKNWGYLKLNFNHWQQQINIIDGTRDSLGRFTKPKLDAMGNTIYETVSESELYGRKINKNNFQDLSNDKLSINQFIEIGKHSFDYNLSYSQNNRREYGSIDIGSTPDLHFFLQTLYFNTKVNFDIGKGYNLIIGSSAMQQMLENKGKTSLYPDYSLTDGGAFAFVKKKYFDKLFVNGGMRYDLRALEIRKLYINDQGAFISNSNNAVGERFAGAGRNYGNYSASLGAVYNVTEHILLRTNISRGFRAPSVAEISSNGEHAGTFKYEIGNLNLKSEVATQFDFGIDYNYKQILLELNIFQNSISNYTFSKKINNQNGLDSTVNGVPVFLYTQGNALLRGIEGSIVYKPKQLKNISFSQTYALVIGKNQSFPTKDGQYLPLMPQPRWLSRINYNIPKVIQELKDLNIYVEGDYNQSQDRYFAAFNTETYTPSYFLLNAGISFQTLSQKLTLAIICNNILDEAYQNHQSRLKYLDPNLKSGTRGVYNMGRNFIFKVIFNF